MLLGGFFPEIGNCEMVLETKAFGTMFYDDGYIYFADRNIPRAAVFTIDDVVGEGRIDLVKE
jgi:hypothetical protein